MKKWSKNDKGFSLAEVVVAAGILGIGALILVKTKSLSVDSERRSIVQTNATLLNEDLIKGATNLLSKSEDANGRKVRGVCPLVSSPTLSPGVGSINISLANAGKVFNNDSNWDNFFPSWQETKNKECELKGAWGKCYKVIPSKVVASFSEGDLEKKDIIASVAIYPVNMNPHTNGGGSLFKRLTLSDRKLYDAKDIGFEIVATVNFNNDKMERRKKVMSDFFWAPNVGVCDYTLKDGKTKVKLSLNGSGASDPSGMTVYNRSGFTGNLKEPIDINWKKTQVQAGIVTNNGNFITSDTSKNIFGSCNETKYRCPQVKSNQREYGPINLYTNVQYNKYNKVNDGNGSNTMTFKPRIQLKKGSGGDLFSTSNQTYTFRNDTKKAGEESTLKGAHSLAFMITDRNSKDATKVCRSICTEQTNYNTNDASWEDRYTPYLKSRFASSLESYQYSSGQELGCTACYMKNCSQFGLGTFGPMAAMPSQPLDSSLPECSLKESKTRVNTPATYFSAKKVGTPWSTSESSCMSATLNRSTNELEYKPEDCAKKLPVLCYNFGAYVLARDVLNNKEALSYVTYTDAGNRCYRMGREVARPSELDQYIGGKFDAPKNKDGNYDFINLAQQGIFLAPQYKQDIVDMSSWFVENGIPNQKRFWVAMVRDGKSNIIARPPFAPKYDSQDRFALYFTGGGSLVAQKYPSSLEIGQSSGPKAFILSHHIKFKGLFAAAAQKPFGTKRIPFLCRRKGIDGDYFISKKDSFKFDEGAMICSAEGGVFIPPTTPVGWVSAMSKLNPFSGQYGYPNPRQVKKDEIPVAWVGMSSGGTPDNYHKNWYYASSDVKYVGGTSKYIPTGSDNGYTIINGDGDFINPRAELVGSVVVDAPAMTIAAGKHFSLFSSSHFHENPKINDSTTPKIQNLEDWVGVLNAKLAGADFRVKLASPGQKKVIASGKKPGPGNYIKLDNNAASRFGFNYGNREAKSPEGYHLCFTPGDGKVSMKSYYSKCSGYMIRKDEVLGSKSGRALLTIINQPAATLIDLPQ